MERDRHPCCMSLALTDGVGMKKPSRLETILFVESYPVVTPIRSHNQHYSLVHGSGSDSFDVFVESRRLPMLGRKSVRFSEQLEVVREYEVRFLPSQARAPFSVVAPSGVTWTILDAERRVLTQHGTIRTTSGEWGVDYQSNG
jgi:hypothetical protein